MCRDMDSASASATKPCMVSKNTETSMIQIGSTISCHAKMTFGNKKSVLRTCLPVYIHASSFRPSCLVGPGARCSGKSGTEPHHCLFHFCSEGDTDSHHSICFACTCDRYSGNNNLHNALWRHSAWTGDWSSSHKACCRLAVKCTDNFLPHPPLQVVFDVQTSAIHQHHCTSALLTQHRDLTYPSTLFASLWCICQSQTHPTAQTE